MPAFADIYQINGVVQEDFHFPFTVGQTIDLGQIITDGTCTLCTTASGDMVVHLHSIGIVPELDASNPSCGIGLPPVCIDVAPTFDVSNLALDLFVSTNPNIGRIDIAGTTGSGGVLGPVPAYSWAADDVTGDARGTYTITSTVPEPSTMLLLGTVVLLLSLFSRLYHRLI
jgi:hypothetical protein